MKKVLTTLAFLLFITVNGQRCETINTRAVVNYLNNQIKPSLDLKLDRRDGFIAIKRQRQDLVLPEATYQVGFGYNTWKYSFNNVRRIDCNFFYGRDNNLFALDVKFESDAAEMKGYCIGCVSTSDTRGGPDMHWVSVQILRIYLRPKVYDNSISFVVADVEFLGDFRTNRSDREMVTSLISNAQEIVKLELQRIFLRNQTQRLFSDVLKPLLRYNNITALRSVSLASSTMMMCR